MDQQLEKEEFLAAFVVNFSSQSMVAKHVGHFDRILRISPDIVEIPDFVPMDTDLTGVLFEYGLGSVVSIIQKSELELIILGQHSSRVHLFHGINRLLTRQVEIRIIAETEIHLKQLKDNYIYICNAYLT